MGSQITLDAPPLRDALDDEELLPGQDVTQAPGLSLRRSEARRVRQPQLEARLRDSQRLHFGTASGEVVPRLEVRGERLVVQVGSETDEGGQPEEPKPPTRP